MDRSWAKEKLMAKNDRAGSSAVLERPTVLLKSPPVRVSYPVENEIIAYPSYTLQISVVEPAAAVEISIDQADWQPCREALGLWWYDWSGYDSGEYEIVARTRRMDGTLETSEPRIFEVKLG